MKEKEIKDLPVILGIMTLLNLMLFLRHGMKKLHFIPKLPLNATAATTIITTIWHDVVIVVICCSLCETKVNTALASRRLAWPYEVTIGAILARRQFGEVGCGFNGALRERRS